MDRKKLISQAIKFENKYYLDAVLKVASKLPPIASTFDSFDRDPWLIGCKNGVLDLRTKVLRPGRPADMLTRSTGIPYLPGEPCPLWIQSIDKIFRGDEDLMGFFQKAVGYSLSGSTEEQCFFLLHGSGSNGKTTVLNTLSTVYGSYAQNTTSSTLLEDPRGPKVQTNDLAALRGVRLVTASELSSGGKLDEGRIKAITGGDPITARFLRQEFFTYRPEFKVFFAVNHKPVIRGTDWAIWRRLRLVPFMVEFKKEDGADPNLGRKLADEASGILAWSVEGFQRWQTEGLGDAVAVSEATCAYREESDLIGTFLREQTSHTPGSRVQSSLLYGAFRAWSEKNGLRPLSNIKFSKLLVERGIRKETHGEVYYYDMELSKLPPGGLEEPEDFSYNPL